MITANPQIRRKRSLSLTKTMNTKTVDCEHTPSPPLYLFFFSTDSLQSVSIPAKCTDPDGRTSRCAVRLFL